MHSSFANLLQMDDEDDDNDTEEYKKPNNNEHKSNSWLYLINEYSDVTKTAWDNIWEKSIIEFFNVISFSREKSRREEEFLKQWKMTH